ncbi:major facilitator superfamily multidrug-resistance, DHA1 sub-family [Gymnopilus junonius]|uniref:Major facilitator superfamily multidrug-resistance, DHA1 sub-family n=1 Tax=Gymnopilus junonius TaxID=109634 RepID=A0A9P5NEM7_GYMJU|nr:major facilitator superfamily multidrug-resistance, DHA1 sub-family [Gymnopilus junonius]
MAAQAQGGTTSQRAVTTTHDIHEFDDDHENETENQKPTPLPIAPLLSIFLIQLAEPVTATVIYPFINQFVRETGITGGDEKKTGYYAGIIESAFFFAESVTVIQWGYLSDRYGRRPILLLGPLGLGVAMLLFGMSTTFWPLVVSRCFQGIFNGNIGLSLSLLTDSTNRGDAYAFIPLVWSFGTTTGPILGGVLSNAATHWPDTFGRIPYLRTHPYFLPCFIAATFSFATFIIVLFALKETLPSLVHEEKLKRHHKYISDEIPSTSESRLIDNGDSHHYGTENSSLRHATAASESSALLGQIEPTSLVDMPSKPDATGLWVILTRPILMTLVNHIFLTFLDMCHFALIPLMYSTPVEFGGLGLKPFEIGIILGTFGFVNSIVQAKFLGGFIRKFGGRKVYRLSFSCLLVCFGMYPVLHFFSQRAGGVDAFVMIFIIIQFSFQMAIYMAYGSLQVVLVESIPEGGPMGTVNGVAQMVGSGMRSLAPTFASSLFSISLQRGIAGGNMVYFILLAMTLVGVRCTVLLPKRVSEKRRSSRRI